MTSALPEWHTTLQTDNQLNESLNLVWLDAEEQQSMQRNSLLIWDDISLENEFTATCRERLQRSLPVALGLSRFRLLSQVESQLVLFFDPEAPDVPWVSLSAALPSVLWIKGASTASLLQERLEPYLQAERPNMVSFEKVVRLLKPIQVEDPAVVCQVVESLEPWMDDASWQNGNLEDPWTTIGDNPSLLSLHAYKDRAANQHQGRFSSTSFRSLWSRSVLTIEQLPLHSWVFEVRYNPVKHSEEMERLEEALGCPFPLRDVPLDLVASLLREGVVTSKELREQAWSDPYAAVSLISLEPGEPSSFALLEHWMEQHRNDEDMLRDWVDFASRHNFRSLLFEAALSLPPGSSLRRELEEFVRPQGAAV